MVRETLLSQRSSEKKGCHEVISVHGGGGSLRLFQMITIIKGAIKNYVLLPCNYPALFTLLVPLLFVWRKEQNPSLIN
jgi:hypothetical protein